MPIAGLLSAAFWINDLLVDGPDPIKDPVAYAHAATSPVALMLGYGSMASAMAIIIGVLALGATLATSPLRNSATIGTVLGVVAMVIVFAIWTLLTVGGAIVGDTVLAGHAGAGAVYSSMSGGNWSGRAVPLLSVLVISGLVAAVCLGASYWRSGRRHAPWIAIAFAVALVLEAATAPIVTLVGSLLMIVVGATIAHQVTRSRPGL